MSITELIYRKKSIETALICAELALFGADIKDIAKEMEVGFSGIESGVTGKLNGISLSRDKEKKMIDNCLSIYDELSFLVEELSKKIDVVKRYRGTLNPEKKDK